MRLGSLDCGCDNRRYVMFQAGRIGLPEAVILAAAIAALVVARKVGHR